MTTARLSPEARRLLRKRIRDAADAHHVDMGEIDLNRATKAQLMELAEKAGVDVLEVINEARLGPNAKTRKTTEGGVASRESHSTHIEGHIPFDITITANGMTETYKAFFAYDWHEQFERNEEGELIPGDGSGRFVVKVLTTATPDDGAYTSKSLPIQITDEHGSYLTEEPVPIVLSDPTLSRLLPDAFMESMWNTVDARSETDGKEELE